MYVPRRTQIKSRANCFHNTTLLSKCTQLPQVHQLYAPNIALYPKCAPAMCTSSVSRSKSLSSSVRTFHMCTGYMSQIYLFIPNMCQLYVPSKSLSSSVRTFHMCTGSMSCSKSLSSSYSDRWKLASGAPATVQAVLSIIWCPLYIFH